jgi:CBS domain-containing protein
MAIKELSGPAAQYGGTIEENSVPLTAADIMTSPAIVASAETTMLQIAAILATRGIRAVPICGPDRTLLGIISEADILRPMRAFARRRREWWLAVPTEDEALPRDFLESIYVEIGARRPT